MNKKEKKLSFNFLEKIKENKILKFTIIAILLIIFILLTFSNTKNSDESNDGVSQNYTSEIESKLENILSKIDGVGKVNVAITIDGTSERVIAMKKTSTENSGKITTEETPILVNGKTVTLKELNPTIVGVLIVAEGAENLAVLKKIQQATTSLLDVNINKIEILSMN